MKNILKMLLIFCIIILLPYILIACMSGFSFDMKEWKDNPCICYVLLTIILAVSVLITIKQTILDN